MGQIQDEAVDFIYQSTDYSKFKPLKGNRTINTTHLAKLKESFDKHVLKAVIYVNEDYEIIDGQHRYQVLVQKNLPIQYIVCPGYSLDEIQIYNQNSKNWATEDFLESYVKLGKPEYITFKKFQDVHKLPLTALFTIFWGEDRGIYRKWKEGRIKINDIEWGNKMAYRLAEVRKVIGKIAVKREFVRAFCRVNKVPKFDHAHMLHKLKLFKGKITQQPTAYSYIEMLDGFYNYRQSSNEKLDILGWLRNKGLAHNSVRNYTKK